MRASRRDGYTLIEIVVALVVFTTGALGLAAGSAIVTRELTANGIRSTAARLARNRQEQVHADCASAQSGSESLGSVKSSWTVAHADFSLVLAGTISYPTRRGTRVDAYTLTVQCR